MYYKGTQINESRCIRLQNHIQTKCFINGFNNMVYVLSGKRETTITRENVSNILRSKKPNKLKEQANGPDLVELHKKSLSKSFERIPPKPVLGAVLKLRAVRVSTKALAVSLHFVWCFFIKYNYWHFFSGNSLYLIQSCVLTIYIYFIALLFGFIFHPILSLKQAIGNDCCWCTF